MGGLLKAKVQATGTDPQKHTMANTLSVGEQALKVTKTIGAAYVERKGESVIGRNPQQMHVIETAHPTHSMCLTPSTI